mgnify:CR=1 FL=1
MYKTISTCKHFFGTISNGKMELNKIGEIVDREWKRTFAIRPDMNLWMDEFVVMLEAGRRDDFNELRGVQYK